MLLLPPQNPVTTSPGGGAWVGDSRFPNFLSLLASPPPRNLSSNLVGNTQCWWRGLSGCWQDALAGSRLHLLPPHLMVPAQAGGALQHRERAVSKKCLAGSCPLQAGMEISHQRKTWKLPSCLGEWGCAAMGGPFDAI